MAEAKRWEELASAVRRRRTAMGMRQGDIPANGGPSSGTVKNLEQSARTTYSERTIADLEVALMWKPGDVERLLTGALTPDEKAALLDRPSGWDPPLLAGMKRAQQQLAQAGMAAGSGTAGDPREQTSPAHENSDPAKWGPVPLSRSRNAVGEALMLAANTDPPVPEAVKLLRSALDVMLDADSKTGS